MQSMGSADFVSSPFLSKTVLTGKVICLLIKLMKILHHVIFICVSKAAGSQQMEYPKQGFFHE